MLNLILGIIPGLMKLGDKMIEDKDQRNEFAFKVMEMQNTLMTKALEMKTYPAVDALVKLALTSEAIIKGLFRPLASTAALAFVCYCAYAGIKLDPMVEGVLSSLLPAWGISRYKEKMAAKKDADNDTNGIGW